MDPTRGASRFYKHEINLGRHRSNNNHSINTPENKINQPPFFYFFKTANGTFYSKQQVEKLIKGKWLTKCDNKYPDGNSPLFHILGKVDNQRHSVFFLLKHLPNYSIFNSAPKNNLDQNILHFAARSNDPEIFRRVLAHSYTIFRPFPMDKNHQTPLHILIVNNDFLGVARYLFHTDKYSKQDVLSSHIDDFFSIALKNGNKEICILLAASIKALLGEHHPIVQKCFNNYKICPFFYEKKFDLFRQLMCPITSPETKLRRSCQYDEPVLFHALLPLNLDEYQHYTYHRYNFTRNHIFEAVFTCNTPAQYAILLSLDLDAADFVDNKVILHAAKKWQDFRLFAIGLQKIHPEKTAIVKLCLAFAKQQYLKTITPEERDFVFSNGEDLHRDKNIFSLRNFVKYGSILNILGNYSLESPLNPTSQGFIPTDKDYSRVIEEKNFNVAIQMLKTGTLPTGPLHFKLKDEKEGNPKYEFAHEWLMRIQDPWKRFNLALQIGNNKQPKLIAKFFDGVLAMPISVSQKIVAICQGSQNVNELKAHLNQGFSELTKEQIATAWTYCCWQDKHEFIEALVQAGVDPRLKDAEENTGLHLAGMCCSLRVLHYLIDLKVIPIEAQNIKKETAWDLVSQNGSVNVFQAYYLFLKAKYSVMDWDIALGIWPRLTIAQRIEILPHNPTFVFLCASLCGDLVYLEKAMAFAECIQIPIPMKIDFLKKVIALQDLITLEFIFKSKLIDFHLTDQLGRGILHWAVDKGFKDTLYLLVKNMSIDVDYQDKAGYTALQLYFHFSVNNFSAEISAELAQILILCGAKKFDSLTIKEIWKCYCAKNSVEWITSLAQLDLIPPTMPNEDTPLHYAALALADHTLEYLLKMNYWSVKHTGRNKKTVLQTICSTKKLPLEAKKALKCLQLVIPYVSNEINNVDENGLTPLAAVCKTFWEFKSNREVDKEILKILLNHGANPLSAKKYYEEIYKEEINSRPVVCATYYSTGIEYRYAGFKEYDIIKYRRKEKAPKTYKLLSENQ